MDRQAEITKQQEQLKAVMQNTAPSLRSKIDSAVGIDKQSDAIDKLVDPNGDAFEN